jgi:hypothetical protein
MCCNGVSVPLKDHDSAQGSPAKPPQNDPLLMVFAQNFDNGTRELGLSASSALARPKILNQPQQHPRAGVGADVRENGEAAE